MIRTERTYNPGETMKDAVYYCWVEDQYKEFPCRVLPDGAIQATAGIGILLCFWHPEDYIRIAGAMYRLEHVGKVDFSREFTL